MARNRGTETRRMQSQALVRMPPNLAAAVESAAAAAGLSVSAWIRRQLVDLTGAAPTDARPTPPPVPVRIPPADVAEVARLTSAIGMATGAAIQLAKALREAGAVDHHAEAERAVRDLRRAAAEAVELAEAIRC